MNGPQPNIPTDSQSDTGSGVLTYALIGNPNCGKTTLFNALTGAHQRVGNWPGVTVEMKTGEFELGEREVTLIDLPGIYSLEQEFLGIDEQIAMDYLKEGQARCIINIVDAGNLERNLVLTQQLLEKGLNLVVALNMLDVARQQGIEVNAAALAEKLGVPVIPLIASTGKGIEELENALLAASTAPRQSIALADEAGSEPNRKNETGTESDTEKNAVSDKLVRRYHRARALTLGVVEITPTHSNLTEAIDRWVLNRWLGIPFFLLMMYVMFTLAINLGAVFIDFFDILFGAFLVDGVGALMGSLGLPAWMIVLVANGLGGGVQLVATFIPVIGFLFLCLSLLEDSGYMARAGFVVDRLMSSIGLPGSAFVPLIVGFGCNVPSVMASRTLGRDSDRLLTIAMAPFMSCGARLTVYALFAAAFFPQNGPNIVFLLYLLGVAMAVATGFVFRQQIFDSEATPSFQEMPAYHIPVLRNILLTTWNRLRAFILRAGKTIVLVVVGLSFLNSIGTDGSFGNEDSEASALSVVGKAITPVFSPLGLTPDNWPATVGLFTGLFAKEAVVGTLDALYSEPAGEPAELDLLGATGDAFESIVVNGIGLADAFVDPLGLSIVSDTSAEGQGVSSSTLTNMASLFGSQFAAFCYLVFVLLYAPCVAVLGATAKEAGVPWMLLVFGWTTGLAYITATAIYQAGTFAEHPVFSGAWLMGCALVLGVSVHGLKRVGRRAVPKNLIPAVQVG